MVHFVCPLTSWTDLGRKKFAVTLKHHLVGEHSIFFFTSKAIVSTASHQTTSFNTVWIERLLAPEIEYSESLKLRYGEWSVFDESTKQMVNQGYAKCCFKSCS